MKSKTAFGVALMMNILCVCMGAAQTLPTYPQRHLDTEYRLPTGTTRYVQGSDCTGKDPCSTGDAGFQTQLDAAAAGDVIIVEAGQTFTGNYNLPDKNIGNDNDGDEEWVYIISSNLANLPEGVRVGPADEADMPKIVSVDANDPVIYPTAGADHWRFAGISFSTGQAITTLLQLGGRAVPSNGDAYSLNAAVDTEAKLVHHIILDRCYIYSSDENNRLRIGANMTGFAMGVVDSHISNIKDTTDAQAVIVWFAGATATTTGPFKFQNNYLEATGMSVMFGGAGINIANSIPADIQYFRNYVPKPFKWDKNHADFNNIPTASGWGNKNLFELKNAERVHISGNIFEHNFADDQTGRAILFSVRNQNGDTDWVVVQDVAFDNNIIRGSNSGFSITGTDSNETSEQTKRILIENNIIEDMSLDWGISPRFIEITSGSASSPVLDLTVRKNLMLIANDEVGQSTMIFGTNGDQANPMLVQDNIMSHAQNGMGPFFTYAVGTSAFNNNGLIYNADATGYAGLLSNFESTYNDPSNASGNVKADTLDAADFTTDPPGAEQYADIFTGIIGSGVADYTIKGTSPFSGAASDGGDIGPDLDLLKSAVRCVYVGNCGVAGIRGSRAF